MELEGLEVAVEAQVECEPPPGAWCHIKCQQHQVWTAGAWVGIDWLSTSAGYIVLVTAQALTLRNRWLPQLSPFPSLTSKLMSQGFCLLIPLLILSLHSGTPQFQF